MFYDRVVNARPALACLRIEAHASFCGSLFGDAFRGTSRFHTH